VLRELALEVHAGECVALGGASGAGKSSILKMVHGNYAVDRGSIVLQAQGRVIDIAAAGPRQVLAARRDAVGYVSQFLGCVPRAAALQIVTELIREKLARGTAILGIFHDAEVRDAVARRVVSVEMFAAPAGAAA
jgi:alpha-D-ribose 1-methylphosphonate 5-triphosphate synthase subunit PhnL